MTKKINEGVLDGADDEGFVAKRKLYDIAKYAIELHKTIQDGDEIEPWVQEKLTLAAGYVDDVKHYIEYEQYREVEDTVDELDLDLEPAIEFDAELEANEVYDEMVDRLNATLPEDINDLLEKCSTRRKKHARNNKLAEESDVRPGFKEMSSYKFKTKMRELGATAGKGMYPTYKVDGKTVGYTERDEDMLDGDRYYQKFFIKSDLV